MPLDKKLIYKDKFVFDTSHLSGFTHSFHKMNVKRKKMGLKSFNPHLDKLLYIRSYDGCWVKFVSDLKYKKVNSGILMLVKDIKNDGYSELFDPKSLHFLEAKAFILPNFCLKVDLENASLSEAGRFWLLTSKCPFCEKNLEKAFCTDKNLIFKCGDTEHDFMLRTLRKNPLDKDFLMIIEDKIFNVKATFDSRVNKYLLANTVKTPKEIKVYDNLMSMIEKYKKTMGNFI